VARGSERGKGMGLGARFALSMTIALSIVMLAAGFWIHRSADNLAAKARDHAVAGAVVLTTDAPRYEQAGSGWEVPGVRGVTAFPVTYDSGKRAVLYRYETGQGKSDWLVPVAKESVGSQLAKVIGIIMLLVVLVGALVALWVAGQVVGPLKKVIDDIRQIARGDLGHRTHARGGGEVALLAKAIDRMSGDLEDAREAELELSMREREIELAAGVREALMPFETPHVEGYDLRAAHLPSGELLGDFHLFVPLEDGRVGLVVCDVSGLGVPAALIGATARAYLASELALGGNLKEAFCRVNRRLEGDVRRGMYVTALCVIVDPATGSGEVVCAGHKVPLLIFTAADKKLRKVHPGGIALGFDKGPVFERSLEVETFELAVGDRFVLSSVGPIQAQDPDGNELGEDAWFKTVARTAGQPTTPFLRGLKKTIEDFTADEPYVKDVTILTIQREA